MNEYDALRTPSTRVTPNTQSTPGQATQGNQAVSTGQTPLAVQRFRKSRRGIVISAVIAVIVVAAAIAAFVWWQNRPTTVPCGSLGSYAQAEAAVASHHDLVDELAQVDDGISVEVRRADGCPSDGDLGYVVISGASGSSRAELGQVISRSGFGVHTVIE